MHHPYLHDPMLGMAWYGRFGDNIRVGDLFHVYVVFYLYQYLYNLSY